MYKIEIIKERRKEQNYRGKERKVNNLKNVKRNYKKELL